MKKQNAAAILITLVVLVTSWQQGHFVVASSEDALSSKHHEGMPNLQGEPAVNYLKERGLFESVRTAVEAERHEIKWQSRTDLVVAGWKATNPGQNLEATFSREGTTIMPSRSCDGASWQVALQLRGVGYGERLRSVVSGPMLANGNRIEFQRLVSASEQHTTITEWYVNKPEGIEQGFTLAERPGTSFGIEPLRVALSVRGELHASLEDGGQAVVLGYQKERKALRYDHLVAHDALGRTLPSRMEVSGDEISLLVDDASAFYPVTIDPLFTEVKKLTASDGASSDGFGSSVAISGDTAVVGADGDDGSRGSAYLFERNKGGADLWGEVKKLAASDGAGGDRFGSSVAISNDTVVVGAHRDDAAKGSAYVFERNKGGADLWGEVRKLTASDGASTDGFGSSVAISGDTAIVGADGDDGSRGSAYVFERNRGGADLWGEVRKLTASDGASTDSLGVSVALSGDTAVVGADGDDTAKGSAYIFERNKSGADLWGEVKKLTASDGAGSDHFGNSVGISNDTVVVGAYGDDLAKGSAYVFERNKGGADLWGEVKKVTASDGVTADRFGISVGISNDIVVVGAEGDDAAKGSAYAFERNNGGADLWGMVKKLTASDGATTDHFGFSLAISGDTVLVGADGDDLAKGSSYLFATDCEWAEKRKPIASDGAAGDEFGRSVAISGDLAIVGAQGDDTDKGSAWVLERNKGGANLWGEVKKLTAPDGAANDSFGESVSISGDTAIIGSSAHDGFMGAAYIFQRNSGGADFWGLAKKLTSSLADVGDAFGFSVAISGDTAIVGAFGDNGGRGRVFVFERNQGGADLWGEVAILIASDAAAIDGFGLSVAISGDTAVIGASGDDSARGAAYVRERNRGGANVWGEVKKLTASDGRASDFFGGSVAISGDTAIVGAHFDNLNKGAAYVFERNSGGADQWGEVKKLTASDGTANDRLGVSVSISGDTAVVGADRDGTNRGAAYVFDRNKGGADLWGEAKKLTASDGAFGDFFGVSVSISGDTTIVGALGVAPQIGASYVFVCEPTCPVITLSDLPNAQANTPYNETIVASPADAYSFAVTSGALPPGLSLTPEGVLTGAATQGGVFNFRVTATAYCTGFRDYVLIVSCPAITLNPASLPGGTVGTAYSQSVIASPTGTYTYSVKSGSLPLGLTLDATTGAITGTPTTVGTSIFTIGAAAGICVGTQAYTIAVACPVISITPTSLTAGTSGTAYSQQLNVSPAGSYTFSLVQGSLPSGTTLTPSTGLINGMAMVPGTYTFIVKAQMPNGCSTTQALSITVNCPTVTVNPATLPNGQIGTPYSQMLSVVPAASYSFSVVAGALPPGLALNPLSGQLSGTPKANGPFNFTVTATGPYGCAGSRPYTVTIEPGACQPITLPALSNGKVGTLYLKYVTPLPAGVYSYSLTGTLPPGLTFYGATGMIFGYPTSAGSFNFSITATNVNGCTGNSAYSVTIAP